MPETRLAKARASLPEGYQFGDAGHAAWAPFKPSGLLAMKRAIDGAMMALNPDRCRPVAFPSWTPRTHLYEFQEGRDA